MGLETVLGALLVLQMVGCIVFRRFEIETPVWRSLLKWSIIHGATIGLYFAIGLYALVVPMFFLALGGTAHMVICRREGFDPITASPREKYYAYRGWAWPPE